MYGKTPRYHMEGKREKRWIPTPAKAQNTRVSPISLETHLVKTSRNSPSVIGCVKKYELTKKCVMKDCSSRDAGK